MKEQKNKIPFPATPLKTEMTWEDLVVNSLIQEEVKQIKTWIEHRDQLLKDISFRKHIKPGYQALFHGPPGTGKTLTASLLGKYTKRDVYRIDLSLLISKYIGETEKNISSLLEKAEKRDAILFFDEADSLFGKRTEVRDAHDKYANQEISYLLQRLEASPSIAIFRANNNNIDSAFVRRFQSVIHFSIPDKEERLQLWKQIFSGALQPEASVNLENIAEEFELSGESITNIMRNSTLDTIQKKKKEISKEDLSTNIKKELRRIR